MKETLENSPVRIPVRLVDGKWEYFYGGDLPVRNGTVGDLVIDKSAIENRTFLSNLRRVSEQKLMDAGTELLVALTIRPSPDLDGKLKALLIPMEKMDSKLGADFYYTTRSPDTQFITISIGPPTAIQTRIRPEDEGGIWLHLQGLQPKGLKTSSVIVPSEISGDPLESLNYAFTRLSEKFEPWRKSHTGNIYDRVLYQEINQKWYPLNVLRYAATARKEHQLAQEKWKQVFQQLQFDF